MQRLAFFEQVRLQGGATILEAPPATDVGVYEIFRFRKQPKQDSLNKTNTTISHNLCKNPTSLYPRRAKAAEKLDLN